MPAASYPWITPPGDDSEKRCLDPAMRQDRAPDMERGVEWETILSASDLGSAPREATKKTAARPGKPGRVNRLPPTFRDPQTGGFLDNPEVAYLADRLAVTVRTLERWFGIPGNNQQVQYRNIADTRLFPKGVRGVNLDSLTEWKPRYRVMLSALLTCHNDNGLPGGVYRAFANDASVKRDYQGRAYLYEFPPMRRGTLADALECADQVVSGGYYYDHQGQDIAWNWQRLWIERRTGAGEWGWYVRVLRTYSSEGNDGGGPGPGQKRRSDRAKFLNPNWKTENDYEDEETMPHDVEDGEE